MLVKYRVYYLLLINFQFARVEIASEILPAFLDDSVHRLRFINSAEKTVFDIVQRRIGDRSLR